MQHLYLDENKRIQVLNHLVSRNWFLYPHTLYRARQLLGTQQIFEELMNEYTKTCWRIERLSIKLKTLKGNVVRLLFCPLLLPQYYRENSISFFIVCLFWISPHQNRLLQCFQDFKRQNRSKRIQCRHHQLNIQFQQSMSFALRAH